MLEILKILAMEFQRIILSVKRKVIQIHWSDIGQHFGGHQNSDDDGKPNYIHFERYINRRNRNIYCLIAKLVLLISYLSSLFCNYIHLCH